MTLVSAEARPRHGGVPARRAVIRWAWRLLRREWRQQLLMLALVTVAVAATVIGAAVATNTPPPANAGFGTAQDLVTLPGSNPHLAAQIAMLRQHFGPVDVIENQTLAIPGSIDTYSLRAQDAHGPFGQPMLSLVSGHYPTGAGQVAVTGGLAGDFHLSVGSSWQAAGTTRQVTGIVQNPQNLQDEFALVARGQVTHPDQVTVLFDGQRAVNLQALPASIRNSVQTPQSVAASNVINPETISLAAAVLGMLLIALVGVGGFTVLAQRRLRSIGMLGAQGATDAHIRLVVRANGAATGLVGAVAGFVLGLVAWLAYRPSLESSAHHVIGLFQLPWPVVIVAMALAVVATFFAASRPARAVARMPIVTALSGRPAPPKQVRRWAVPAGIVLLAGGFILLGMAGAQVGAPPPGPGAGGGGGGSKADLPQLVFGLLAVAIAVVLLAPAGLAVLARLGGRAPIPVRLALRDLARYRARSGSALGAVSISVLIAAIVIVVCAARFGNVLDYAGPNLTSSQLIVYTPGSGPGGQAGPGSQGGQAGQGGPGSSGQQPATGGRPSAVASARAIAAALGSRQVITLEQADASLRHAASGRNWSGPVYVATPQLLSAFGIKTTAVSPDADILTMRPGLDTMPEMQLLYGTKPGPGDQGNNSYPCPAGSCLASPGIEEASALPSGTSAPNTVITEQAMRTLGLASSTTGWLIQAPRPLTSSQIYNARHTAAAAGMSIETQNSIPSLSQITNVATVFVIVLVLGILAMSVGLLRSETAGDLRTLTAAGAGSLIRRGLTATTAGALALAGAVAGLVCGYITAIGFFRTNQLDGLSALGSIPVANLLLILAGMPLAAAAGGWLLAGREPAGLTRQPGE